MKETCPACLGPRVVNHPDVLATFQHETRCILVRREAETLADDLARFDRYGTASRFRVSTVAERLLLEASGLTVPTSGPVFTKVSWHDGTRTRSWKQQPVTSADEVTRG